jgi:hypothetical protein
LVTRLFVILCAFAICLMELCVGVCWGLAK